MQRLEAWIREAAAELGGVDHGQPLERRDRGALVRCLSARRGGQDRRYRRDPQRPGIARRVRDGIGRGRHRGRRLAEPCQRH
ncbi:MAG: hypothetical protein KDE27_01605, partial [Planctomycetes bacterium]|nr:hypothetical protein [Planctomycetota bacterium]